MSLTRYLLIIFCFVSISCSSNTDDEVLQIGTFLFNNNLVAEETVDGVYIVFDEKGIAPFELSNVNLKYTGYYLDKVVFDTTKTVNINTSALINGLRLGLKHFGQGGKGTIIVPSKRGYGANPPRGVRKNAILIYDIELF
jgi:FKBP-type peptidyl-prolyl cis-trans isomerase FkpA